MFAFRKLISLSFLGSLLVFLVLGISPLEASKRSAAPQPLAEENPLKKSKTEGTFSLENTADLALQPSAHASNQEAPTPPHQDPILGELIKDSFCFHLTDVLPKNGVMIPGASLPNPFYLAPGQEKQIIFSDQEAIPARSTIHFCWNQPVPSESHTSGTAISNRKYCILETLEALKSKWYGGYHQDLLIVGKHQLSKDSLIFVPVSDYEHESKEQLALLKKENPDFKGSFHGYVHWKGVSRSVSDYIEDKSRKDGTSSIRKVFFLNPKSPYPEDWKAEIHFKTNRKSLKIDVQDVFMPILEERFWGIHNSSQLGIVDKILIFLNRGFTNSRWMTWDRVFFHPDEIEKALILLDYHQKKLTLELETHPLQEVKDFVRERDQKLTSWLTLIKFDQVLGKQNKSIYMNKVLLQEFIKERHNNEKLTEIGSQVESNEYFNEIYEERIQSALTNNESAHLPLFIEVAMNMNSGDIIEMVNFLQTKKFVVEPRILELINALTLKEKIQWPARNQDLEIFKRLLPNASDHH